MTTMYSITPELRVKLKRPIGTLIRGSFAETMSRFRRMVEQEKPPFIISVGDTVSKNLVNNCVFPQLSIVDNRVMRRKTQSLHLETERVMHVKNPPGTIAGEAIVAIEEALRGDFRVGIVVDGEEDLLTLVVVSHAPENSFVVYGQPYEGIVVVKVTREKRTEVAEILRAMEVVRKAK